MFEATMKNGKKIYFDDVSKMAKEENRLDYASMVDWCTDGHMVGLNVSPWKMAEDWERQTADDDEEDYEVFQWFIISGDAAQFFMQFTNELIYYSEELDMYILGVTHFGTAWSYVMTEWKLGEEISCL